MANRDGTLKAISLQSSPTAVGAWNTAGSCELDQKARRAGENLWNADQSNAERVIRAIGVHNLVARGGKLITQPDKRSKMDKSLSGYKSLLKTDPVDARGRADRIIRNTYRTLLTRGLKGCYVFCTDAETQAYFAQWSQRHPPTVMRPEP